MPPARTARFRPTSPLGRHLAQHRDEIITLAQAHKANNVRVFGSVARGEDDEASDIDLLVDLDTDADLLDLAGLTRAVEHLLRHPVDIIPVCMLKPHLAGPALTEAMRL